MQQTPKQDHPWRRYKNKPLLPATEEELASDKHLPSLKNFLADIVENWDTYTIPANDFSHEYVKIKHLTSPRSAAWLSAFLQKTWVKREATMEIF